MQFIYCILYLCLITFSRSEVYHYDSYSVFCACSEPGREHHVLSCPKGKVIRMELKGFPMRFTMVGVCPITDEESCHLDALSEFGIFEMPFMYRLEVYKNCTANNSCIIGLPHNNNMNVFIHIVYKCYRKNDFIHISNPIALRNISSKSIFYFSGADHIGGKIDCKCSVSSEKPSKLDIWFISIGDESCKNIQIRLDNVPLITCGYHQLISPSKLIWEEVPHTNMKLHVTIERLKPSLDDILFFSVSGSEMDINCSGCHKSEVHSSEIEDLLLAFSIIWNVFLSIGRTLFGYTL